jgi:hypothetical protein
VIGATTNAKAASVAGTATARARQVAVPRRRHGIVAASPISVRPAAAASTPVTSPPSPP